MKINDGNSVQGLYNANTTPPEVIFTKGDIVVLGSTLYTCKGETTSLPSITSPNWEVYMGDKWRLLNSLNDIENYDPNNVNYIGPEGLSQFIKARLGGLNSNGRLQVLVDPTIVELSSMTKNSVFQLDYSYLTHPSMEPLPFTPDPNTIVVVRTIGEMSNPTLNIFVQEIIVYPQTGNYKSWVRFGPDLALATWSPTRGNSFDNEAIIALDNIVQSYTTARVAYQTLLTNIGNGNFYSYELVDILQPRNSITFSTLGDLIDNTQVRLSKDYHYKVFLKSDIGSGNYSTLSIDISPDDFSYLAIASSEMRYFPDSIKMTRDTIVPGSSSWTLNSDLNEYGITRILRAKNVIA